MKEADAPRERTEEFERLNLSSRARLAAETKGRDRYEEPDPLRTVFQQDRERLASSSALHRLSGVAAGLPLEGGPDALGETLAVAQITRTLARALRLNEDLAEAIALGREIGQPPFGAAGRAALGGIAGAAFKPGEQALRVVERLSAGGAGLNLTFETRDGIVQREPHSVMSLEGELVAAVAAFHLLSRELDCALAAGLARAADVPTSVRTLGSSHPRRVAACIDDIVNTSSVEPRPRGSERLEATHAELAAWHAERLENHPQVLAAAERAVHCLRSIAVYYLEHPAALPAAEHTDQSVELRVVDTVCSLTDATAVGLFETLFLPTTLRD